MATPMVAGRRAYTASMVPSVLQRMPDANAATNASHASLTSFVPRGQRIVTAAHDPADVAPHNNRREASRGKKKRGHGHKMQQNMESREMPAPSRLPCVWGLPVVLEGGTAGSGQGRQGSSNNTDRAINFFSNCSLVRRIIEAKIEKK